jgi:hypothetical protein
MQKSGLSINYIPQNLLIDKSKMLIVVFISNIR